MEQIPCKNIKPMIKHMERNLNHFESGVIRYSKDKTQDNTKVGNHYCDKTSLKTELLLFQRILAS